MTSALMRWCEFESPAPATPHPPKEANWIRAVADAPGDTATVIDDGFLAILTYTFSTSGAGSQQIHYNQPKMKLLFFRTRYPYC